MKRALILAAILALLAVPASGISPSHWERVPESAFQSFVPDGPVDAGRFPGGDPVGSRGGGRFDSGFSPAPSILPSGRPTYTPRPVPLVPPYVGIKGVATFYAYHPGQAAAARRLRDALGPNWRGMTVRVCGPLRCLRIVLTDYESSTIPGRLIDLDRSDFARLCGDLGRGVCDVVVTR